MKTKPKAEKRGRGRPPTDIKTGSTRLHQDLIAKAQVLAIHEDPALATSDYLSGLLRPIIDERWRRYAESITQEARR